MQLLMEPFGSLDDYLAWVQDRPGGERYEVVDGHPVMRPSTTGWHQLALTRLVIALDGACPDGYVVLPAPLDWVMWEKPLLGIREPDLVMVPLVEARAPRLVRPPLLAVEVLSPSSFERDAVTKRREYARAGLDHYWIVEPRTPQIAVYRRKNGTLEMVAHALGDSELAVDEPLTVRIRPAALVQSA